MSEQTGAARYALRFEDARAGGYLRATDAIDEIHLETVWVAAPARSHGVGTQLLVRLLLLADALERPVRLEARPIGVGAAHAAEARRRLVAWYRRFGFEVVDPGASLPTMVRPPRREPTSAPRFAVEHGG